MSKSAVLTPVLPWLPASEDSSIAIIGGAPGADEVLKGQPFAGKYGMELNRWLHQLELIRENQLLSYVFQYKPTRDDAGNYFIRKGSMKKDKEAWSSDFPLHSEWGALKREYASDLIALRDTLHKCNVKVVIGLGPVALWAFTGLTKIGSHRGTVFEALPFWGDIKFIATYEPQFVMRGNFDKRMMVISDFQKGLRELGSDSIIRIKREIWTEPQYEDMVSFVDKYCAPQAKIAFDIETGHDEITCVGFAPDTEHALVVPFRDDSMPDRSYWPTHKSEVRAWQWVKDLLESPEYTFVAQNGSYDIIWLKERMGITVHTPFEDTMHQHHAWQPEMPKALGVLGSLYTNEGSWKHLVSHSVEQRGNKRDE